MVFTDAQAWLDAHEVIECKPLKGRWTRKTCMEISGRSGKTAQKKGKTVTPTRTLPCADCPILAALEK